MTRIITPSNEIVYHCSMNKFIVPFFVFSFITLSCKKDKLTGYTEILAGKWNWINTQKVTNTCAADSLWNISYLDSATADNRFSLEFIKKGKVYFYHNGGLLWKDRIVFDTYKEIDSGSYQYEFVIRLNNKKNDLLKGLVGADSLQVPDFPLDVDGDCDLRYNYFVRE